MDSKRFDALVQSLARAGSRRRLLGGALAGALVPLSAAAKRNSKSSRRHAADPGTAQGEPTDADAAANPDAASHVDPARHKKHTCRATGKRCVEHPADAAGHGVVTSQRHGKRKRHRRPSCSKCCTHFGAPGAGGKTVCACKPEGESCAGAAECCGGLCRNGACTACAADCDEGQRCKDGICVCDGQSCAKGCCQGDDCVPFAQQSDSVCGTSGEACHACADPETCGGGDPGKDGVCGCTPEPLATTCGEQRCVMVQNYCGQPVACPCTVFVTSLVYNGDLDGASGGDGSCNSSAETASLEGDYKAWLADDSGTPATRLKHWAGPYVLVDGTVVANDWDDLTSGSLRHAIDQDENGGQVSISQVWTNATAAGDLADAANDCAGWTTADAGVNGGIGTADSHTTNSLWTDAGFSVCSALHHLYCFQQA